MSEIESVLKNGTTDYQLGSDRLSDLPLSIIHIILTRVPIEDAIRTCILSSHWRYTWNTLPELVFNDYCESHNYVFSERYTENFISQTLLHHKGPIQKVILELSVHDCQSEIDKWVHCLSRKDIRELSISTDDISGDLLQLHTIIYSCKKLTFLNLCWCILDAPPPTFFKGFLFLRCLILQSIYLSPNQIESLIVSCPLLERLYLWDCRDSKLTISVPNLKYLDLSGGYYDMSLNTPLLAEMGVHLFDDEVFTDIYEEEETPVCNYTNFLGGFMILEKLTGKGYFTKFLSMGIESCHDSLVFHHLKAVELHDVNTRDKNEILVVSRLIISAPNLQHLTLEFKIYFKLEDASEDWDGCLRDLGFPPKFKLEKLRFVKIISFAGLPVERKFIRFLLESSPMLETMNVYYTTRLCAEEIQNLSDKLLSCIPSNFCKRRDFDLHCSFKCNSNNPVCVLHRLMK